MNMISRRRFNQSIVTLAFTGLSRHLLASPSAPTNDSLPLTYGELLNDPNGLIDLPAGFSYKVISSLNEKMTDGLLVPDRADGMACFYLDDDRVTLIRNHELSPKHQTNTSANEKMLDLAYDSFQNAYPLPGGTSNIIYNHKLQQIEHQFMSLIGTIRNCSGGITPWGTWLTCEESTVKKDNQLSKDHGYVFEIPANATAMVKAVPIVAMGRFNHEAACVDPRTGIVYMTEDRDDSLLYRFIPKVKGRLHEGGHLQALTISQRPKFDTRNWDKTSISLNVEMEAHWIDLDNPQSPDDDLRLRGHKAGAALFARGEGIHWGNNELYFCCTNGGAKKLGQIMRYVPSLPEGSSLEKNTPGKLSLFVESENKQSLNFGDNITVAPNGHLIVCEDQYTDQVDNHLKGVTTNGQVYDFARIKLQTEPAGACFSPDGNTMFVNLYSPTTTLAITGPWNKFNQ
ncbi:MAG: secreted PhoX family phosphatase [Cognaticolwellia sp.]|jgi:secreted PhoX family phosphatase